MKNIFATIALALTASFAHAGVDTGTDNNDVILAGHDTVAYHTEGKPVEGDANITAVHNDAIYRFASTDNRDLFIADPQRYAPVYGGFCAYGTALGKKFQVNGKAFEVIGGRLYVNKNLDVYAAWKKDVPNNIVKAEGHWPTIRDTAADQL